MSPKKLEDLQVAVQSINYYNNMIKWHQELIGKYFVDIIECFYPDMLTDDPDVKLEIVDDFLTIVLDGKRIYLQHLQPEF